MTTLVIASLAGYIVGSSAVDQSNDFENLKDLHSVASNVTFSGSYGATSGFHQDYGSLSVQQKIKHYPKSIEQIIPHTVTGSGTISKI